MTCPDLPALPSGDPQPDFACSSQLAPQLAAPLSAPLSDALTDAALSAAWERVLANGGAAGSDHETLDDFGRHLADELQRLRQEVLAGSYAPQPLQLVPIPKARGGQRMLAIPAVRDRVLQTAVARLIGPHLDQLFAPDSYGYRPGRSVAQAVARVQAYRDAGLVHVVDADIHSYFDHIDHRRLLELLKAHVLDEGIRHLVELWLAAVLWERGKLPRLQTKGVGQGSPLSPLLSNLYLDAFDHALQSRGLAVVRYADDFVVLCPDALTASRALALVRKILNDFKLSLNEAKTRLTSFEAGFEFLGARFRRRHVEPVHEESRPWLLPARVPAEPQSMPLPQGPFSQEPELPSSPLPSEPQAGTTLAALDPALQEAADEEEIASSGVRLLGAERASPLLQSLYVGQPGCWLSKSHDRVVVSARHEVLASVPLHQLDQIAILDNAMVSTALLRHCARHRVKVAIAGWGDELLTLDRGGLADQGLLKAQWAVQQDDSLQLLLAASFVEGKLHNSRAVLRRFTRHEGRPVIEGYLQAIDRMQARLVQAGDLNTVRGLEGQAARHYFEALRLLLPIGTDFAARTRRPPRDPVNASLSMGYAMLANNLHTLVRLEGLNAHLGHLHAAAPCSMALVSDLMEEFRAPVVDSVVLHLWRQGGLCDTDFEWSDDPDELPCRLRSQGRHRLLAALEDRLQSQQLHPGTRRLLDLRRIMQAQVRHYLRVLLRREALYRPFKLR